MKTQSDNRTFFYLFILLAALILGLASCETGPDIPDQGIPPKPQPQPPAGTPAILQRIADKLAQGDFEGALGLFDTIPPEDAGKSGIRLLKASVLISGGRLNDARSLAGEVSAGEPENTQALMVLSAAEGAAGKEKEQKAFLERVLKLEPGHAQALVSMGNIAVRNNAFRTAAGYYDKALASEPDNGDALIGRAWVYRNNRDPKAAEQLLNQAVVLYPRWAVPIHERGRLYNAVGYPREALKDLDKAKALDGTSYWIACDRGEVLIDLNRKQEALEEFQRAIKLSPNHFLAYVYSAGIKDELGDYDGAENDYAILVKLNPDYYFGFEGLGIHLMRKGNWLAARDAFMEAYKRAKQDEVNYGLLAALNWMRGGKIQDPKQFLEQVLRKAPRDSLEYWMLRLYHDLAGDADVAIRIDKEKNIANKARMLYYLANFYDIRGNKSLADRYFLQVRDLDYREIPEWRLNEWALEARGLALSQN
jgi:tetratricopeptide (TPR) repeat protein